MIELDKRAFRNALGSYPTGVCVVTTLRGNTTPFGMTINSFASVSLEPALLLWSIQNDSECFEVFNHCNAFSVSILSNCQQQISDQYATRGEHELLEGDYSIGETGLPIIRGAAATFECKLWQRYAGGDHEIIVGEVQCFKHSPDREPLLFHSGQYGSVA